MDGADQMFDFFGDTEGAFVFGQRCARAYVAACEAV